MITSIVISSLLGGKYVSKKSWFGNFTTVGAISLNLASSLTLVFLNKWLYLNLKFPSVLLTLLHFATTFFCLHICKVINIFTSKSIPLRSVFPLIVSFCGFVVLTNLSLENNTVGTFQVAKVLTTPCVLLIQGKYYQKAASKKVVLTTVPIIAGVFLSFYYDIKFNFAGLVYAGLGVLSTSIYQVLVGEKQAELQVNSMQLLYVQAPLSALLLLPLVFLVEPLEPVLQHSWKTEDMIAVLSSCVVAFGVNLSIYWIIGNTSALSYNMVGHLKFCLTVLGGILLFSDPVTFNQLVGIILTLIGVLSYTHQKMKEDGDKKRANLKLVQNC